MKIRNIEDSGIVKTIITCSDMVLLATSYWLAFAITHGLDLAYILPLPLKIKIIIGALAIIPAAYIAPPLFMKRIIYGDTIIGRTIYMVALQTLFTLSIMSFIHPVNLSQTDIPLGACIFFAFLSIERMICYHILKRSRSKGRNLRYVVLAGSPIALMNIYQTLSNHSFGFKIQGIFTSKDIPDEMKIERLGTHEEIIGYLENRYEVTDLYIVPEPGLTREAKEVFRYCEKHHIRCYIVPLFLDFLTKKMVLTHQGNTMLLSARNEPLEDPLNRFIKRMFDLLISGIFLLTLFPFIYLIVGLIIKHQSPGPILFKQKRNGLDGRVFACLKFRSMHVNDDADKLQATEHDPRKFKFGNFMRKTNIDELPQLINVFKGDMSLVGPRPHMQLHNEQYSQLIDKYMVRHLVKPGITGWAQCQGFRGETKTLEQMENRVKADIWYVENWTFTLDLRIIWRTAMNMIKRNEENAY